MLQEEAEIRAALAEGDIATLAMVLVQFTGDETWLDKIAPYITGGWDWMECVPAPLRQEITGALLPLIAEYRAGRRPAPAAPPEALLKRMMDVCVGATIPDAYVAMLREQVHFSDADTAAVSWSGGVAPAAAQEFKVVVIGAGMSGICSAIKLAELGIPYVVLEKNGSEGGTWFENSYPGCAVDIPNHSYQFSFELNPGWSRYFAERNELLEYFRGCVDKFGIRRHIRLETEVIAARFDAAVSRWTVETRRKDGTTETIVANAVISAVGQLNQPQIPEFPGLADFTGKIVHTARWEQGIDIAGKTVAMIGTGASGMQVAPSIAPDVARLTIFQRSPHWVNSHPNYHRRVGAGKKYALENIPFYTKWYRFKLLWAAGDAIHPSLKRDPDWPNPQRSLNAKNEEMRLAIIKNIEAQLGDDPELLAKVIPDFPPYGKRMLRDNHWFATLKRDNVELVTDKIARIAPDGVVIATGAHYPAEVLVMATGFKARQMLGPMAAAIAGSGGTTLRDRWGEDDPRAYLGITVPGFPNFFIIYGPNTNLAHGGSIIFHTECQVAYILRALVAMIEKGAASIDVRDDVHDAYNDRVDAAHAEMVWANSTASSWYKNSKGRVFATSPWSLVEYWTMTHTFRAEDYVWR
ncbi:MAG: hapE 3, partial [Rhodospirillales bacterium]|nr:hapE 3 [Rhodospirillales bacterium]